MGVSSCKSNALSLRTVRTGQFYSMHVEFVLGPGQDGKNNMVQVVLRSGTAKKPTQKQKGELVEQNQDALEVRNQLFNIFFTVPTLCSNVSI